MSNQSIALIHDYVCIDHLPSLIFSISTKFVIKELLIDRFVLHRPLYLLIVIMVIFIFYLQHCFLYFIQYCENCC